MSRLALAAGSAAVSMMLLSAGPAGATPPLPLSGPTVLTGNANSIGEAGSDTSYWMMQGIAPQYNVAARNTDGDYVTEIPPVNIAPFPAGTVVPFDAIGGTVVWDSTSASVTPPNGSSAGIAALDADASGQIDIARSSRGPKTGETANHQFWAYAIGALDYVTFPGTHAPPAGISQANLIKIYTCGSNGLPLISNWSQIPGGKPGVIVKYLPQTSSGTYSFFTSKLMNGTTPDLNCNAQHLSTFLEEHDARGVTNASKPNAIYAFDYARWTAQSKGTEADLRNGSVLGKFGVSKLIAPSPTTVNTGPNRYFGSRYIYNVNRIDNHPGSYTTQAADARRFVGVSPVAGGGAGFICSGAVSRVIVNAGFVPIPLGATGGAGLPASFCRLNPTDL